MPRTRTRTEKGGRPHFCFICKKEFFADPFDVGTVYHLMWINYEQRYAYLCAACTLNHENFLGVKPYKYENQFAWGRKLTDSSTSTC
jgi:hypothetical protein